MNIRIPKNIRKSVYFLDRLALYCSWILTIHIIQQLLLEWICYVNPPRWEGSEDIPVTEMIAHRLARAAPASLKSSSLAHLCMPDLKVEDAAAQVGELNAIGLIGS